MQPARVQAIDDRAPPKPVLLELPARSNSMLLFRNFRQPPITWLTFDMTYVFKLSHVGGGGGHGGNPP
jgi:hypothetical protein